MSNAERQEVADRLEDAAERGTTGDLVKALASYFNAALLIREGEVVTPELARERAGNMAQALGMLMRRAS